MISMSGLGAAAEVAVGGEGSSVEDGDGEGYTVLRRTVAVDTGVAEKAVAAVAVAEADGVATTCAGVMAEGVILVGAEAGVGENAARAATVDREVRAGDGVPPHPRTVTAIRSPQREATILRPGIGTLS